MNIQLSPVPSTAAGSTAARTAPLPGASGPRESAVPSPPPPTPTPTKAAAPAQAPLSSDAVKKIVVRIVDSQTNEVIRQMPSEEMIAISKSLDQMSGWLIKQKV